GLGSTLVLDGGAINGQAGALATQGATIDVESGTFSNLTAGSSIVDSASVIVNGGQTFVPTPDDPTKSSSALYSASGTSVFALFDGTLQGRVDAGRAVAFPFATNETATFDLAGGAITASPDDPPSRGAGSVFAHDRSTINLSGTQVQNNVTVEHFA